MERIIASRFGKKVSDKGRSSRKKKRNDSDENGSDSDSESGKRKKKGRSKRRSGKRRHCDSEYEDEGKRKRRKRDESSDEENEHQHHTRVGTRRGGEEVIDMQMILIRVHLGILVEGMNGRAEGRHLILMQVVRMIHGLEGVQRGLPRRAGNAATGTMNRDFLGRYMPTSCYGFINYNVEALVLGFLVIH